MRRLLRAVAQVSQDFAFLVNDHRLGVVLLCLYLEKGVVGHSEGDVFNAVKLQLVVVIDLEGDRVVLPLV